MEQRKLTCSKILHVFSLQTCRECRRYFSGEEYCIPSRPQYSDTTWKPTVSMLRKDISDPYVTNLTVSGTSYSRTLLAYLFIRSVRISCRRFIAIRYRFKRSTCIQEPLVIGEVVYKERFKRENSYQQITEASSSLEGQSSNSGGSEAAESVLM
jgi:hypothetical protein